MKQAVQKEDCGEIMLEATIIVTLTLFILIWILGLGFLYYQKYVVRIATNDAAKKIAATYYNPSSDIIMGYVSASDLSNRELYFTSDLSAVNKEKAENYIKYDLQRSNFYNTVKKVEVSMDTKNDSILGRSHVVLTTKCTFDTPFGVALDFFGMNGTVTYSVSAYAEATSITDYVTRVNLGDTLANGNLLKGTGFVEKTIKMINSFVKLFSHVSKSGSGNGSGGGW